MKKRNLRKRRIRGIGIVIAIIFFISRLWPILGTNKQTHIATYGKVEETISVESFIVRNEKVITSGMGKAEYFIAPGEKVAKGQKIAKYILSEEDQSKAKQQLNVIESRIKNIENSQKENSLLKSDLTKIDNQLTQHIDLIQTAINEEDYETADNLKRELDDILDKKNVISGDQSFSGGNLSSLEQEKKLLKEQISNTTKMIHANYAGYIGLGKDGLEEILNMDTVKELQPSDVKTIRNILNDNKKYKDEEGNSALRIITSHRYNIIIPLDKNEVKGLTIGQTLNIREPGDEREYNAQIKKIINDKEANNSLLILNVSEHLPGFHYKRHISLELIKDTRDGIVIPTESIVEQNGNLGVFRVNRIGYIRFIPINVLSQNDKDTVVQNTFFLNDNRERISTITYYDEIVLNPSQYEDGQKIR
ncbi:HlyD family efflux transporter periplasmic adaptor subunit [Serpentinicella sp. ANB-PHB4]|uniref:HlyD family efflux transporter periplasmic adaptor subunit n=1 Tax=Serpentinicella sp. ANB-PHB4 TaxID=3074076 RepID=UPI00285716CE|nr:HlyD family efflux transporter periplasmic adaptor subunit [Serpentinicella sp. ANB-PHB4]MDR5657920.1 HlyD family efflux transporter periplasmic adaptor subunit [Serpentinicella sp. ANB-PHB4]